MVAAPAIGGGISSRMVGLGLVLAADKASLDASLGILTATSALLATKWASNSLVVVAKEGAASSAAAADATAWEAHPLIKVQGLFVGYLLVHAALFSTSACSPRAFGQFLAPATSSSPRSKGVKMRKCHQPTTC